MLDPRPVVSVSAAPGLAGPREGWPYSIPAVVHLLRDGLELDDLTVLVGENGTGKSTIVEAVAMAYGLGAEGGSVNGRDVTWASESPLHESLRLVRGGAASKWGYFLRAETMHGLFTYLQDTLSQDFHRFSHGESFLKMINSERFAGDGFFVMDEPEAGLSFTAQLALVSTLSDMVAEGRTQVLIATHSPVLTTLPGARILELDEEGLHEREWDELEVVDHYRRFLDAPERYLRHLRD